VAYGVRRDHDWEWIAQTDGSQVCQNDPELWHDPNAARQAQAAAVCRARCPFVQSCLLESLVNHEEAQGVWGGMTEGDRARLPAKQRQGYINGLRLQFRTGQKVSA